jgi:hypothetical protein
VDASGLVAKHLTGFADFQSTPRISTPELAKASHQSPAVPNRGREDKDVPRLLLPFTLMLPRSTCVLVESPKASGCCRRAIAARRLSLASDNTHVRASELNSGTLFVGHELCEPG